MTNLSFDLLIFDCDGVLVDSEVLASSADSAVFRSHGISMTDVEIAQRYTGLSYPDMISAVNAEFAKQIDATAFAASSELILQRMFKDELRAVPGMPELASELILPKCVASSSATAKLRMSLKLTNMLHVFDPHIYSTELVEHGKPAPDIILHACNQFGIPAQRTVVIEDSVPGIRAAKAAGANVIGFLGGAHCLPETESNLLEAGATSIARSAAELRRLIP